MPAELPEAGDPFVGTSGPLKGMKGEVQSVDDSGQITVEVSLFGRKVSMAVSADQISWPRRSDPTLLQPLVEGLRADTPRDRAAAATALGELGLRARSAAPMLTASLTDDPRAEVRSAAADALGLVDPEGAEPALLQAVRSDRSVKVIAAALRGLSHATEPLPRLLAPVVGQLRHPHLDVRVEVARLLLRWRASDPALVPELVSAMAEAEDQRHRCILALLLGRIGAATPAVVAEVRRLAEDSVTGPYAYDGAPWFVLGELQAAEVLAEMTDPERYPLLAQVHAAVGLCRCEDERWLLDILAVLERAEHDSDRRRLAESIGAHLGPRASAAAPALVRLARQDGARREAVASLALIGATEALCALLAAREGDDTRAEAALALARSYSRQIDDGLRTAALTAALEDPEARVRRSAAEFLKARRDVPGVTEALAAALAREAHPLTRRRIEEALQRG